MTRFAHRSLLALALSAPAAPWTVAEPVAEIAVTERGVIGVSAWDLQRAGIDPGEIPVAELGVTCAGVRVASSVQDVNGDGLFNGADVVVFFGQTLRDEGIYRNRHTDKNVYLLERWVEGVMPPAPSERLPRLGPGRPLPDSPVSLQRRVHIERDAGWADKFATWREAATDFTYMSTLDFLRHSERTVPFDAPGVDRHAGAPFSVAVMLFGRSSASRFRHQGVTDHSVIVELNGQRIGLVEWDGVTEGYEVLTGLDPRLLRVRGNEMVFRLNRRERVDIDVVHIDWFEVQYPTFAALTEDQAEFAIPGPSAGQTFEITGLTSADIHLLSLTRETVLPVEVHAEPSGTYGARFTAPCDDGLYAIATRQGLSRPASVEAFTTAMPASPAEGIDYLIITHSLFRPEADRLAEFRAGQGMRTMVLDIDDVYDAANFGIPHPDAIREALRRIVQTWPAPALRHVVLMGDASWDHHRISSANPTFIPTHYYHSGEGEYSSDAHFAIYDDQDAIPQVAIGRLPVKTPEEARGAVDKIIAYEQDLAAAGAEGDTGWRHRIIFAASDNPMYRDFLDRAVERFIEGNFELQRAYANDESPLDCTQMILDAFAEGVSFVSYVGHGARYIWQTGTTMARRASDYEANFNPQYVDQLDNSPRLPIVFGITCFTNNFDNPDPRNCIGEKLVLSPAGGAIACIATSSYSYVHSDLAFCDLLFDVLFTDEPQRVGDLFLGALQRPSTPRDVRQMFILLGDPAATLPLTPLPGAPGPRPEADASEASGEAPEIPLPASSEII
ncbi:MAG: hypothetical protein HUU25_05300 [Candidatus Sumerlaeia bacterium]|nr:hypothetical protein [Candidatus Sumerlaeia bacterium]